MSLVLFVTPLLHVDSPWSGPQILLLLLGSLCSCARVYLLILPKGEGQGQAGENTLRKYPRAELDVAKGEFYALISLM